LLGSKLLPDAISAILNRYEDYCALASSNKPFLCPACCLSKHRQLITSLLETVESLKEEVRQLKKGKLTLLPVENPDISNEELHGAEVVEPEVAEPLSALQEKDKPWQTVTGVRKRGQRGRKGDRGAGPVMQATSTTTSNFQTGASSVQVGHTSSKQPTRNHRDPQWLNVKDMMHKRPQQNTVKPGDTAADEVKPKHPCEEVTGIRRIWGTMRSCASRSVLSVLQRLSSVAPNVEVHWKFNSLGSEFSPQGHFHTLQLLNIMS